MARNGMVSAAEMRAILSGNGETDEQRATREANTERREIALEMARLRLRTAYARAESPAVSRPVSRPAVSVSRPGVSPFAMFLVGLLVGILLTVLAV